MKKALVLLAFFVLAGSAMAGDVRVKGHWRDTNGDGVKDTYVQPYVRTSPNSSTYDNYSTKGNVNPYTGQPGTVNPDTYQQQTYPSYDSYQSIYGR